MSNDWDESMWMVWRGSSGNKHLELERHLTG